MSLLSANMSELDNTALELSTQEEVLQAIKRVAPSVNDVYRVRQLSEAYALATGTISTINNATIKTS